LAGTALAVLKFGVCGCRPMGMNYTADAYELIEKRLAAYNHFIRTFDRFNEKTIK